MLAMWGSDVYPRGAWLCRLLIWTAQGSLRSTTPLGNPSCTSKNSTLATSCHKKQYRCPNQSSHHQSSWRS